MPRISSSAAPIRRFAVPRKSGLNWFMPALVNISVGSSCGTTGELGMNVWPPFAAAGIQVRHIGADWRTATVVLRHLPWTRNYVGTAYGGSLFSMASL